MPKLVYIAETATAARGAIVALRNAGFDSSKISVIARSDIELEKLPERYVEEHTDFAPALGKGVAIGGGAGLLAGLIAVAFPPAGIALGGAALLGVTALGAGIGAWSAALAGASVPHERRERYEAEVAAGKIVIFIDVANDEEKSRCLAALGPTSAEVHALES